jgi:hypothetical protein
MQNNDILFRSHNFGELCVSLSKPKLTDLQAIELQRIIEKGDKATDKEKQKLHSLIEKRDAPLQLGDGGKSLVKRIFNENIRNTYRQNVESAYTIKGNELENFAVQRIAKVNGWGFCIKNTQTFQDSIGFGTPDVFKEKAKLGFDAKCSFTDETFPLWDSELKNTNYIWQDKRYAMLCGLDNWFTCYSLENSPEDAIIKHAWQLLRKSGEETMNDAFIDEVRALHNFDHLADWERVKTFEVKLTSEDITIAETASKLAREYYGELLEIYNSMLS